MSRTVAMRPHYRTDASFLLRLEEAIAKDTRQTDAWRKEVTTKVHEVAILLLQACTEEVKEEKGSRQKSAASGK